MTNTRRIFWFLVGFLSTLTFLTCTSLPVKVAPEHITRGVHIQ